MGFNGDLYPTAGATSVLSTKGDIVRYDTERERYGIGSAGQVLTVASDLPTWATLTTADSVLTTQGDVLYEGASALARLGQSTNNYTLATKGAGANPTWQASSTSTLTTAGDLLVASGANTLSRLARGSDNQVLTMNGTALNWETASGGLTITSQKVSLSSANFTTTSTSFVEITDLTIDLQNTAGGEAIIFFSGSAKNDNSANGIYWGIFDDGTIITDSPRTMMDGNTQVKFIGTTTFSDTDGSTITAEAKCDGGTFNVYSNNAAYQATLGTFALA